MSPSKSEKIRILLSTSDLSADEIARRVGCSARLVRHVRVKIRGGSLRNEVAELRERVRTLERAFLALQQTRRVAAEFQTPKAPSAH